MTTKRVSFEIKDKVALLGFGYNCDKSMTVLDEETLIELRDLIDDLHGKSKELDGAVFFSHKERCFLAGADINLIASLKTESEGAHGAEQGQILFNRIEDLSIPTVACVNGVCLGGGMELSLACNAIVASNDNSTASM